MINPVESGLDLFSATMRDIFKESSWLWNIQKLQYFARVTGKNYNNMGTLNVILQGQEQKQTH